MSESDSFMSQNNDLTFPMEVNSTLSDLDTLIQEIKDITDPSSFDKVYFYWQELQEQDDEFMNVLVEKIDDCEVYWEQPWYQKKSSLTRRLVENMSQEELDILKKENNCIFRTDKVTKDENKQILKNWKKLTKKYNVPNNLVSFARWKNKAGKNCQTSKEVRVRNFVTAYLARGLERTLYKVYQHVIKNYAATTKGPYNETEKKIMEIVFCHKPSQMNPILSKILGREPRGIYKKIEENVKGKALTKKVKWTLPLATQLVQSLMRHSNCSLEELKGRFIDTQVWLKVAEDLDHNFECLRKFWYSYLHVQLFVQEDVKMISTRMKIFSLLKERSYKTWTEIYWKDLLPYFPDGMTHYFLCRVARSIYRTKKDFNLCKEPYEKALDYAINKLLKRKRMRNRRLKRVKLDANGDLQFVDRNENITNED